MLKKCECGSGCSRYIFIHEEEPVGQLFMNEYGWVHSVEITDPSMRNRGLGTQMMRECVEKARSLGVRHLHLDAVDSRAKKVYLKVGFVFKKPEYMGNPEHIRMLGYIDECEKDENHDQMWWLSDDLSYMLRRTYYSGGMEMIL